MGLVDRISYPEQEMLFSRATPAFDSGGLQRIAVACLIAGATIVLGTGVVSAQDYPSKPIRVVTSPPGGGLDFVARVIAQGLGGSLGQQMVIDNRATRLLPEIVAKAPPDGHTLLVIGSALWLLPFMATVNHDPVRNFAPITLVATAPLVVVVHPSLPVKSVKSLINFVKARPGQLDYASGSTGSSSHLAAELFMHIAAVKLTRIPYKGVGAAINDLLGGRVQLMFATAASVQAHAESGRLRALAVTSAQPSALAPDLPTLAASGLPGYAAETIYGLFAPGKTPAAIVSQLNREIVRVLRTADVKGKLLNAGLEVVAGSPEAFSAVIKSDMDRMGKVIKEAGIKAD